MTYTLKILRRERGAAQPYWESFTYEAVSEGDTVASALTALNSTAAPKNAKGEPSRPIEWECSCLQKRCGACAMVIDGRPRLACDALLSESKTGALRVEPLRKFPVICDLTVDRTVLYDNLKTLGLWLSAEAALADGDRDLAYESSECIQCGCCMEVCPNFYAEGPFFGMATVPLTTRLLTELSPADYREIARQYAKHTFAGCGKSLACKNVCPRHIDTEKLLVNANALAVWKRKRGKKK